MSLTITKDKYPEIIDLYKNGMSQAKIGELYHVAQCTISSILRKCGIKGTFDSARKVTRVDHERIVQLYQSGLIQQEIADMYGVGQYCISNILIKNNIKPRRYITENQKQNVIELYLSGQSQEQIERDLHMSHNSISAILDAYDVQKRTPSEASRIYNFNEHYFDIIDTPNKAYYLGMLYADGCNQKNNMITLRLQEDDYDILEKLNREIQNERPLLYTPRQCKNYKNTWSLCFGSPYVSQRLCELGCIHTKSLILKYPTWLDLYLQPHFLRGYMDGDGSICKNPKKMSASLVSTHSFCAEAAKLIQKMCNCHCYIYIQAEHENGDATSILKLNHKADACMFLDYIYKDAELYMQRKYDIYKSIYCNNT